MTEEDRSTARSGAQAVERVLRVLELVAEDPDGKDAADIATNLGLSVSTSYRLLGALQRQGYVTRGVSGPRYLLGRTVAELSVAQRRQVLAPPAIRAKLDATREEARAAVYLAQFHGDEMVISHISESPAYPRVQALRVGFLIPTHVSALGKITLATLDRAGVDAYILRAEQTATPVDDPDRLRSQLESVRHEQLAVDREEFEPGTACLAAPVLNARGVPVGAVAVSLDVDEFAKRTETLERIVRRTAWHVSSELAV